MKAKLKMMKYSIAINFLCSAFINAQHSDHGVKLFSLCIYGDAFINIGRLII